MKDQRKPQLSTDVVQQLVRLGAKQRAEPSSRNILHFSGSLPEPLRSFIQDWEWPEDTEYELPDEQGLPERLNTIGMGSIDFAYDPLQVCDECPGCEGKQMVMVGIAEGGNYIFAVRLDDPVPSDPTLYMFGHDEGIREDRGGFNSTRLSRYLSELRVQSNDEEELERQHEEEEARFMNHLIGFMKRVMAKDEKKDDEKDEEK